MKGKGKLSSMGDVGALLLATMPSGGDEDDKGKGSEEMKGDDARELGLEASRLLIGAVHENDAEGVLDAFRSLYRLCPHLREEEAEDMGEALSMNEDD